MVRRQQQQQQQQQQQEQQQQQQQCYCDQLALQPSSAHRRSSTTAEQPATKDPSGNQGISVLTQGSHDRARRSGGIESRVLKVAVDGPGNQVELGHSGES